MNPKKEIERWFFKMSKRYGIPQKEVIKLYNDCDGDRRKVEVMLEYDSRPVGHKSQ